MKTTPTPPAAESALTAHTPLPKRYPMKLVEGFRGISQRVKFSYRGHIIMQEYRNHDVRNKTHNGFWWYTIINDRRTLEMGRTFAKARIDRHVEGLSK